MLTAFTFSRSMRLYDAAYHLTTLGLLRLGGLIHLDFRRRQAIARGEPMYFESTVTRELRRLGVLLGVLAVLLHTLRPDVLAWGEFPLYPALRWLGAWVATAGGSGRTPIAAILTRRISRRHDS